MKKFTVYGVGYYTTNTIVVEADTAEEAEEKYWQEQGNTPSICHYCTKEIEVGDIDRAVVNEED